MINRLYFAQHGLAVSKSENPDRPLSPLGIRQTQHIAQQLHASATPVSHIFHSGKLRAEQTAEIFALNLNITAVSTAPHLFPNDAVSLITKSLHYDHALYIGHLPQLEKLISYLVTGDEEQNIIKLQNSAVVCLEKTTTRYQLQWYLTPDLLSPL